MEDVKKLTSYRVPKLGKDGTCSMKGQYEEQPFDLIKEVFEKENVPLDFQLERIMKLNQARIAVPAFFIFFPFLIFDFCLQVIATLNEEIHVDWLGVYRLVQYQGYCSALSKESFHIDIHTHTQRQCAIFGQGSVCRFSKQSHLSSDERVCHNVEQQLGGIAWQNEIDSGS
jgi:hypothetical protein